MTVVALRNVLFSATLLPESVELSSNTYIDKSISLKIKTKSMLWTNRQLYDAHY